MCFGWTVISPAQIYIQLQWKKENEAFNNKFSQIKNYEITPFILGSEWMVPFKPFSFREFGDNSNQYTILFLKLFKLIVILNTQYGKSSLVSCSVTTRENYQPLPTKHHGSSHNRCQHIDTPQAQPPSPSRFPYQRFYLKICPILLIIFYQLLLFFLFIKQSQSFAVWFFFFKRKIEIQKNHELVKVRIRISNFIGKKWFRSRINNVLFSHHLIFFLKGKPLFCISGGYVCI